MTIPCEVSDTLESCAKYWNLIMKVDAQTRRSRNMWSIQHKQESMLDIECCCSRPQSVTEWEWKNWTNKITENLKKMWIMKVTVVHSITESLGTASKVTNKNIRKREKNANYANNSNINISYNVIEKVGKGTIMKMCYNFISNGRNRLIFVLNEQTHKRQQNNNNNSSKKKLTAFFLSNQIKKPYSNSMWHLKLFV